MRRTALEDLVIGDPSISAGEKVVLWFSAANRDPGVFARPHEFLIDRAPDEHPDLRLGHPLLPGRAPRPRRDPGLLGQALQRGLRFEVTGEPGRVRHNLFRGWADLPVRVVPGRTGG
jgi:hypothetical protein